MARTYIKKAVTAAVPKPLSDKTHFVHIIRQDYVDFNRVVAILSAERITENRRKLINHQEDTILVDMRHGYAVKSFLVLENGVIMKCPVRAETLMRRLKSEPE